MRMPAVKEREGLQDRYLIESPEVHGRYSRLELSSTSGFDRKYAAAIETSSCIWSFPIRANDSFGPFPDHGNGCVAGPCSSSFRIPLLKKVAECLKAD